MMEEEYLELTDTLVITKKFKSPIEFGIYIDEMVTKFRIPYMDAIINYCNEADINIESVAPLINQKLKEKVQIEAEQSNLMKPRGHLPV